MSDLILTRREEPADAPLIEGLHHAAFGPGAYARAAFRVREQAAHDPALSFVTIRDDAIIGSVRLTAIRIGGRNGLLLGPLVVDPCCKNLGYGKALMRLSMDEARKAGWPFILLVGDLAYYWPFGFRVIPPKTVSLPGPVDPARLLVAELKPGSSKDLQGMVTGVAAKKSAAPAERAASGR